MAKYSQPILFLFCCRCEEHHEKTHPHYRAMQQRKAECAKEKAAKAEQQGQREG
jgi:hypothetical protein